MRDGPEKKLKTKKQNTPKGKYHKNLDFSTIKKNSKGSDLYKQERVSNAGCVVYWEVKFLCEWKHRHSVN